VSVANVAFWGIIGAAWGAYDGYKYAKKKKLKGWKKAAAIVGGAALGAVNPCKVAKAAKKVYKFAKSARKAYKAGKLKKKAKKIAKASKAKKLKSYKNTNKNKNKTVKAKKANNKVKKKVSNGSHLNDSRDNSLHQLPEPKNETNNSEELIEELTSNNFEVVINLIKSGEKTSDGRNIVNQLDDKTKILFRLDVGSNAHKVPGYDNPVNHLNIEIQTIGTNGRYKTRWNFHAILDDLGNVTDTVITGPWAK